LLPRYALDFIPSLEHLFMIRPDPREIIPKRRTKPEIEQFLTHWSKTCVLLSPLT